MLGGFSFGVSANPQNSLFQAIVSSSRKIVSDKGGEQIVTLSDTTEYKRSRR